MITIKDYKEGDLDVIKANPLDTEIGILTDYGVGDISFSGYINNDLVGCGGLIVFWKGVAEAWLMLSKKCSELEPQQRSRIVLLLNHKLNELIDKYNLWRIGAVIKTDFPKAIKMAEVLGFRREGLLYKYAPDGTDRYIYGKVK